MSKNVFFTGLKGGVGRSVLAEIYAAFLVNKGKSVTIIDADFNTTASVLRDRIKNMKEYPNNSETYNIVPLDCSKNDSIETARYFLYNQIETVYLVDCRFTHDYANLLTLYELADCIVTPIQYSMDCIYSTLMFITFLRKNNILAPIYILPNMCVKANKVYKDAKTKSQILGQYGDFLPEIPKSVLFNDINSYTKYNKKIKDLTYEAFNVLFEKMQISSDLYDIFKNIDIEGFEKSINIKKSK